MSEIPPESLHAVVVEEELQFSLDELGRACRVERAQLVALVDEGVLTPSGRTPEDWRFAGPSLGRARAALRLARDLELGPTATALVMDLLDQIEDLRSRLKRAGLR